MRVAFIAPLPPQKNGIADYAFVLIQHLRHLGIEIETPLAQISWPDDASAIDAKLSSIDWTRFDLVHAELGGGRTHEFNAMRWLQKNHPDLPTTATLHDPARVIWQPPSLPTWLKKQPPILHKLWSLATNQRTLGLERAFCQALTDIIVLTHTGKSHLASKLSLAAEHIKVIPHGCQRIATIPLPALPPHAPLRLLYFGYIYRGKGIEDLIDAISLLVKQTPTLQRQLHLTIAGGSKPEIAFGGKMTYLDEVRQRLLSAGLNQKQIEWKLDIPETDIPATIQQSHLLVLPYIETKKLALLGKICGTSGVLAWANACGRGVITSNARAFSEEVSYGNGVCYPQRDIRVLAELIKQVLDYPEQITSLHESAQKIGEQRHWPKVATQYAQLFQDACKRITPC